MTPDKFYATIVAPTLDFMATSPSIAVPVSATARVLVMAIPGIESGWAARRQVPVAYARSYYQFERGGGVAGLFAHPATKLKLGTVCASQDILYDPDVVFEAMAWHDMLACSMARLLLWSDPEPLPAYHDKAAGWQYYQRLWRPGSPRPDAWSNIHDQAMAAAGLPPS